MTQLHLPLKLSKSCVNVSAGPGRPEQAKHKHTGKKIVMVCTLQSSACSAGTGRLALFPFSLPSPQSSMKIEGGQASRRVFRSLFDETAKVKPGCEESEPCKEISQEKFLSDALEKMPGRLAFCRKPTSEAVFEQRREAAMRMFKCRDIRKILNTPN